MDKIDRLGWAAGISFVSYGLRIGIRTNDPGIVDRLITLLPPYTKPGGQRVKHLYSLVVGGAKPGSRVRRYNLVYARSSRLDRLMDLDGIIEVLESDLHVYVADMARRRVFVHAGVVGWRGKAIVIPGRSLSGKSTLVAALVRAGAKYYSDEYAVFDSRGRVHPYAMPLKLRHDAKDSAVNHRAVRLPGRPGVKPLPVGLVVATSYEQGARWRPRALPPGRAMMAMLAHTVSARTNPQAALATLGQVTPHALVLKGRRGEAEEMADVLLRTASEPVSWKSAHRDNRKLLAYSA